MHTHQIYAELSAHKVTAISRDMDIILPTRHNPENQNGNTMISQATKQAITALLAVDPTATDTEREAVALAMQGSNDPAVLKIKDVAKRLGLTRQTIYNMVRRGDLAPVKSGGICTGITTQSLARYLHGAA